MSLPGRHMCWWLAAIFNPPCDHPSVSDFSDSPLRVRKSSENPHHAPPLLFWHTIITPRCPWRDPHADVREGFWVQCGFQGVWVTDLVIKWKNSRAEREGAPRHLRSLNASRGKALCSTWPLFVLQGTHSYMRSYTCIPSNGRLQSAQQHTTSHFCNTNR